MTLRLSSRRFSSSSIFLRIRRSTASLNWISSATDKSANWHRVASSIAAPLRKSAQRRTSLGQKRGESSSYHFPPQFVSCPPRFQVGALKNCSSPCPVSSERVVRELAAGTRGCPEATAQSQNASRSS